MTILMSLFIHFDYVLILFHYIVTYDTQFFLNYFTLSQLSLFFYHNPLQMINL